MARKMFCVTTILVILSGSVVFAQQTAPVSTAAEFQKFFIPKKDVQYLTDSLESCLMELRTDGRYQSQAYGKKDEGTWQQLEDGRIRLSSETRYRPLATDEFSIMGGDKESLAQLSAMRERINGLLASNNRETFTAREIKDVSKYTGSDGKEATGVSTFSAQKDFSRADLVDLISAIDAYLKDQEKNVSYMTAYQYPQYGFFQDDFSSWEVPPRLLEKIEKDGIKVPDGDGYIGRLNNLLKVRGLSGYFSKIQLLSEAAGLLTRETELDQRELMRLNRLVIEAAYPNECPKGALDGKIVFLFEETNEFENLDGVRKKLDTGFAPQFAMRRIDKARYDELASAENEQARAFGKMDQQHQNERASAPKLPPAEAKVCLFPKGQPEYFAQSGSHTEYLVFQPDGKYRETESGHFGVGEIDSGTWEQSPEGRIKMISAQKFHNVESGSLSIFISGQDDITRLSTLKEKITDFLSRNAQEKISATNVMGLMQYQARNGNTISVVRLNFPAETTSRNNLKKLQAKIDDYLKNSEKNVFYCTPYVYRDAKFLIPEDQFSTLDDIKASIDRKELPFVFMGVDAKTFEQSSGKPQPFRYYPEMNKAVEQIQKNEGAHKGNK